MKRAVIKKILLSLELLIHFKWIFFFMIIKKGGQEGVGHLRFS
jgi:hypothetical protein